MELNTRTVYSNYLQTCMVTGLPFVMRAFTTLNERFDIESGVAPAANVLPTLRYMAIGNKGHTMAIGSDGMAIPQPVQHLATDAAAFGPIPYVLRDPLNDLSPIERVNYALRKQISVNGDAYIAYYLRRIDLSGVLATMEHRVIEDDQSTTVTPFVPDSSNLNPTPQVLDENGTNVLTGEYVAATAKVAINLTAWEVAELLNVAQVLYGSPDYAIISEIELVTAVDKTISVNGSSGTFNFNEVICAQVASHIAAFYPMQFSQNGIDIFLDIGASEPLWKLAGN